MENNESNVTKGYSSQEQITEQEVKTFRQLFKKFLHSYKEKDPSVTNAQWLEYIFKTELPETSAEQAKKDAEDIVKAIGDYDENLKSVNEAYQKGTSGEKWLADKIEEASVGASVNEFGKSLEAIDSILYDTNETLSAQLEQRAMVDLGNGVKRPNMNKNLDGIMAENMIASSAELNAKLKGKNIRVDVLESTNKNSVDVRAVDLDTGKYQNYQLKFGKDAEATIDLIEKGNYNNQRIVVPKEQLDAVKKHFEEKGSGKTISDRIEAFGVEGSSFTKEEMKALQKNVQEEGALPKMDYSHYQTKELAMSIAKNAGAASLHSAAISAGVTAASKIINGESIDSDELVEVAIKTGADTALKTVTAGTLKVAISKGIITIIPKATPAGIVANIACVGIENVKTLAKIASGELTVSKGLDQIKRTTISMAGGFFGAAKGAALGAAATAWIPVVGPVLGAVTGLIGGAVGYFGGSKVGEAIYTGAKKVFSAAKSAAKTAWNGIKSGAKAAARVVGKAARSVVGRVFGL